MRRIDIADVSHFVHPDTPMDSEAAARGTTVYLVDKRIDMLPALLGTNLCSLRPHVERLAFSVIWVCRHKPNRVDQVKLPLERFQRNRIRLPTSHKSTSTLRKRDEGLTYWLNINAAVTNKYIVANPFARKKNGKISTVYATKTTPKRQHERI